MLTTLGRFLRKLRIDHDEILKDMADKLKVTASFLSAVENGKKRMPSEWNSKICDLYSLNSEQRNEFTSAISESEKKIEMNFQGAASSNRKLAISFARSFTEFDDKQIEAIKKIMQGGTSD
ncbi:MAG: helix-turn-helix domain-containing protein [Clostridiales bacterium]|nr:helix-turn-helix domain-containing protein [Clostridiales bacterium]